jgi:hypothetical protein
MNLLKKEEPKKALMTKIVPTSGQLVHELI